MTQTCSCFRNFHHKGKGHQDCHAVCRQGHCGLLSRLVMHGRWPGRAFLSLDGVGAFGHWRLIMSVVRQIQVNDDYRDVDNDQKVPLGVHTSLDQAISILPSLFLYRLIQNSITLLSRIARTLEIQQFRHDATLLSSCASRMPRRRIYRSYAWWR